MVAREAFSALSYLKVLIFNQMFDFIQNILSQNILIVLLNFLKIRFKS